MWVYQLLIDKGGHGVKQKITRMQSCHQSLAKCAFLSDSEW